MCIHSPVFTFQKQTVPSALPDRAWRASSLISTEVTLSLCPCRVRIQSPVSTLQRRSVSSPLPESTYRALPSIATEVTLFVCPSKFFICQAARIPECEQMRESLRHNSRFSDVRSYPGSSRACRANANASAKRPSLRAFSPCSNSSATCVSLCTSSACDCKRDSRSGYVPAFSTGNCQSSIVLSSLPDKAYRPSSVRPTEVTLSVCPSKVRKHFPVSVSQRRTVLSFPPESA